MQLDELELKNCCQHTHFKHKFRSGITGVIGPNGSGKSNLIRMISASLLCNFRSSGYHLSDNIGFSGKTATVLATWRHKEISFNIRRHLVQTRSESLYKDSNGVSLNHAMEIDRKISSIVGASRNVIEHYVFVDQWGVFGFLFDTPAERAKSFMQLCSMEYVGNIKTQIIRYVRDDKKFITESIESKEQVSAELEELVRKLAEERENYTALKSEILSKKDCEYHSNRIKAFEQRRKLTSELAQLSRQFEEKDKELNVAVEVQHRLQKRLDSLNELVDESYTQVTDSKATLAKLEHLDQKHYTLNKRKADLQEILQNDEVKPVCTVLETCDELYEQSSSIKEKVDHCAQKIALFIEEGAAVCPTCDTKVESIADLDKLEDLHADLAAQHTEVKQKLAERKAYENKLAEWNKAKAVKDSLVASIKDEIARLEKEINNLRESLGEVDREALDYILRSHEQLQAKRAKVVKELNESSHAASELSGEHRSLSNRISKIKVKILDLPEIGEQAYQDSKRSLKKQEDALARKELQIKIVQDLERQCSQAQKKHDALGQLQLRNAVAKQWLVKLEKMRELFKVLPTMVMSAFMEKVVEETVKYLELFNSPFEVRPGKTFSIEVRKPSTSWFNAKRLSGGEKVVLALAVRLAISSLFARDLGILVLDEPTAGMDTDNVDYLCDVLTSLGALLKKADEQVIMVTHDTRLERAFDDVIVLGKK